ncbi:MAG TPA: PIN domain-containing protein [Caldimonas sp.]|nr:PIN domain-containing protein [Caldimonas sp.]
MPPFATPPLPLHLVIDTNVVLDWLAFRNPIGAPLEEALTSGQFRWLFTRVMRDEFAHVIARESLTRWAIDADAVLAVYDALGVDVGAPPLPGAGQRLRCSDPDDQPFLDLAIANRVHALLTRDRALLRLAPKARRLDVLIATPEMWLRASASGRLRTAHRDVCRYAARSNLA